MRNSTGPKNHNQRSLNRLLRWIAGRDARELQLLASAVLIGLGAGFGALLFRGLIGWVTSLSFEGGKQVFDVLGAYYVLILPALGGLVVGPLLYFFAPEAKGHGVPEVMYAVALKGGRIRPVVALIKALASSVCIGSGGSAGREGPIVQIGSSLGSTLGQALKMSSNGIRLMVACGAAGGIAATFNAPVAGVIFALEVILAEFAIGHFVTIVIASVTASVIARVFIGDVAAFQVAEYTLRSPWELFFYALLGIGAAIVGVLFTKLLYATEDLFAGWKAPEYLKPACGGLGVGVIGLFWPQVFGTGYGAIEQVLHNEMFVGTALVLVGAKLLATSLTLGSGGSGGVFAPSLFIGAMMGGAFGDLLNRWIPSITAPAGAYSLVGMAAVFAAAARAPITAVIILFEMTGDYRIILPLMLSTVIATVVARRLEPESIYSLKLSRRGIHLQSGRDVDVMEGVTVSEVMSHDVAPVRASLPLEELPGHFQTHQGRVFPVVDDDDRLCGIVSMQDLSRSLEEPVQGGKTVGEISTGSVLTASPDETMWEALQKMAPRDLSSLPVVATDSSQRLVGMIRRRDIVRAYNLAIARRSRIESRVTARIDRGDDVQYVDFEVCGDSRAVGRPLAGLEIPRRCIIVSIHRQGKILIPRGDTRFEEGDRVTAFVGRRGTRILEGIFGSKKDS